MGIPQIKSECREDEKRMDESSSRVLQKLLPTVVVVVVVGRHEIELVE